MGLSYCEVCKELLTGNQRLFCSKVCKELHRNARVLDTVCSKCGKIYKISQIGLRLQRSTSPKHRAHDSICKSCVTSKNNYARFSGKPEKNPNWKGGKNHWQEGTLGRDKEGLSWKVQRKLAWERDQYTCQHCGKTKGTRNPDIHHINPYRLSFSHALDNLICLCQVCHKKAEAKIEALWGGHTFQPPPRKGNPPVLCGVCEQRRKVDESNTCRSCRNVAILAKARDLLAKGLNLSQVAIKFSIERTRLWHLLH